MSSKNNSVIVIYCKDCGARFSLTEGEKKFFISRGISTPRRCRKCRAAKRTVLSSQKHFKLGQVLQVAGEE